MPSQSEADYFENVVYTNLFQENLGKELEKDVIFFWCN
jgi:hypothetical protein